MILTSCDILLEPLGPLLLGEATLDGRIHDSLLYHVSKTIGASANVILH